MAFAARQPLVPNGRGLDVGPAGQRTLYPRYRATRRRLQVHVPQPRLRGYEAYNEVATEMRPER